MLGYEFENKSGELEFGLYIVHKTEVVLQRPVKHWKLSAKAILNSQKTSGKILEKLVLHHLTWYGPAFLEDTCRSQ